MPVHRVLATSREVSCRTAGQRALANSLHRAAGAGIHTVMLIIADPADSNRDANPYNWLLYRSLTALGATVREVRPYRPAWGADVFHVHWPEEFLHRPSNLRALATGLRLGLKLASYRLLRVPIVWTVHNLKPHEQRRPRLTRWFYRQFPRCCAGLIFLSEATREAALAAHPALRSIPCRVIAHGHYREVYPAPPSRGVARARLAIPQHENVLLYFGMIRPYKNVPALIRCFIEAALPNTRLIVAGRVLDNEPLRQQVIQAAAGSAQVTLKLEYLPDDDLAALLAAANLVVLPYREIANSGSAILALSLNRPVLAPARGSLLQLRAQVEDDWLRLYPDELTPQALTEAVAAAPPATTAPNLAALDWPHIARETLDFFKSLQAHAA